MRIGLGLDAIAAQLNDQLHEDLGQGRFVTAWLAEVDSDQRRVRALSAGQAPILVFRKARGQCEILAADGPPLGVLPGIAPQHPWLVRHVPRRHPRRDLRRHL